jgi:hypothetical protein
LKAQASAAAQIDDRTIEIDGVVYTFSGPPPQVEHLFTEEERALRYAWQLIDLYYTYWTEHLSEEQREQTAQLGLIRARDEDELLAFLRYLLHDETINLEAAMFRAFPVEQRYMDAIGANPLILEQDRAWRVYRTLHPESGAVAHLEPITRPSWPAAPGWDRPYWWERAAEQRVG